ncbi:MAG: aspartate/glutamate racemase family protein [Deltaproteobacteria bacterium]|nr:aspartate/glutamate racemase family protein [Deltaproteobacteria bacterium]
MYRFNNKIATNMPKNPQQAIAGFPVGIIVVEDTMLLLPGNVANAQSFDFPVLYEVLEGIRAHQVMAGEPAVGERVIEAGRKLVKRGARVVLGACGSFANYQKQTAAALSVPTFLTVMIQVPLILASLAPDRKLGVIAAAASALTPKVFDQCGITDPGRLVIDEAIQLESFNRMGDCDAGFDAEQLSQDMKGLATKMVDAHPEIAAILLQCSDMPPFAAAIQDAVQLPVFDMTSLIEWAAKAAQRRPY